MSHTTTIKKVLVKDVEALKAAVARLQAEGAKISLKENCVPRMYYREQEQRTGVCEYVVHIEDGRYDVGFKQQEDGSFAMEFDIHGGDIRKHLGADNRYKCATTDEDKQSNIGKLMQYYGIEAARAKITSQGMVIEQETLDEYGNVQFVVGGLN